MHLLLVTGHSALSMSPQAQLWVRDTLYKRLIVEPRDTVLIVRDGGGHIEHYAREQAHDCGFHWVAWGDDGWRHSSRTASALWAPLTEPRPVDPLRAMAAVVADHRCRGGSAEVLALTTPRSWTDPLRALAERLRLWIDQRICPYYVPPWEEP